MKHFVYILKKSLTKIALNSNDDKRLQTFDRITTYMDTIFMNSENSKTSEPRTLILKLTDK